MAPTTLILSILDSSLKLLLISLENATPEQRAERIQAHNEHVARWESALEKLKFWD